MIKRCWHQQQSNPNLLRDRPLLYFGGPKAFREVGEHLPQSYSKDNPSGSQNQLNIVFLFFRYNLRFHKAFQ